LKVPESIRSKYKPPVALRNSGIFILKPNNINKGDMYELHYKVDGDFHGTSIKRGAAPEVWSGKALGFHKHNLPGMLWYGTTPALKGILSSVELGGLGYQKWEEGR
jgi:hypothetical protein